MTRRKLVALVAAAVLFTIGLVLIGTGLFVMHTDKGRGIVRGFVVPKIAGVVHKGSLHVGRVSGDFINGFEVDTIAIRDDHGELFLSTGHVRVWWNWRDLIDNRVYISKMTVEHPYVHIIQHENYKWNFKEIFDNPKKGPDQPKNLNARSLGDYIVLDSVSARNTTFLLTMPWHPDDELKGAARDSAIRAHLANPAKMVSKTYDGYGRTYAWRNGSGLLSHVRLADPDSNKFGRLFKIATMSVDEYEPTFKFRNLRGEVQHIGDTINLRVPHFELPASVGNASGRVWWGSDRPVRYAIDIRGDSVSLDDVNWVYPTLPRTGGGSVDLLIRNDPADEHIVDFRLKNMDMRSTSSHLTGEMWFGTGARVLLVRNVNLNAQPVTFDLIRALNGKPFPYDWRGDIIGTVRARGGPLTHFVVDEAHGRFEDAHVRGAVSRFSGRGELDILQPAYTTFHGFDVNAEVLDLRTIEFLNPAFPRLGGVVSGTVTLDSSWLDVRFSNAHLAHQDGPGEPSWFSGSGRVTNGTFMVYDVSLNAEPVNIAMLARSKPFETLKPVHGLFTGPIKLRGTAPDLEISAALQGPGGVFSYEGRADLDSLGGYAAHGRGDFNNVSLPKLFQKDELPGGALAGHYAVNLDSILLTKSSVRGTAELSLDRTIVEGVRVAPATAKVRFVDGKMVIVDSLLLRTDAFTAKAWGAVGLPEGAPDTLRFAVRVDSLGGLRPFISDSTASEPDSLSGLATAIGVARGRLDSLAVEGSLYGSRLYWNKDRADSLYARFDLRNVFTNPTGNVFARADSVSLAGIALDTLGFTLEVADSAHRAFTVGARTLNGATAVGGGTWLKDATGNTVTFDSLSMAIAQSRWRLASPARLTIDSALTRLDSALLRNGDSAFVAVAANIPAEGPASALLRAVNIPLKDVGEIAQLSDTLYGVGSATLTATGTKSHPVIDGSANLSSIRWRGVDVERIVGNASYRDFRITSADTVFRGGKRAVSAKISWPADITLLGMKRRNDSVNVALNADTTDLAILQPLFKGTVDSVKGRLFGDVSITGTTAAKVYNGGVRIVDGEALVKPAGVRFRAINGLFDGGVNAAGQDSINVTMSARTSNRDRVSLTGWVANLAPQRNQTTRFDLKLDADSLHAFNRRSIADVYLSTTQTMRLRGTRESPVLTGAINVDRGAIYLADRDLARKLAVETLVDAGPTVTTGTSTIVTDILTNLRIDQVPVTIGQEFRLRSTEADVGLTGALFLVKSSNPSRVIVSTGQLVPNLSLEGTLSTTTNGTYNVNLGLVQREFSVLPGGTVTFDGGDPETPLVDIKARYNVNRFNDRPLGVIVNLKGRMPTPTLEFTSDADYTIATSDLLSYLIIGQPGFDFGANAQASQLLASVLSPTISALTADRLRGVLGSFVDFQLEFGNYRVGDAGQNPFSSQNILNYLYTASISAEKRVYSNLYLGLNAGLCAVREIGTNGLSGLGAKAEYRFKPQLSLQASYDPPSESRTSCLDREYVLSQGLVGLTRPPGQFAFSVRHSWRF